MQGLPVDDCSWQHGKTAPAHRHRPTQIMATDHTEIVGISIKFAYGPLIMLLQMAQRWVEFLRSPLFLFAFKVVFIFVIINCNCSLQLQNWKAFSLQGGKHWQSPWRGWQSTVASRGVICPPYCYSKGGHLATFSTGFCFGWHTTSMMAMAEHRILRVFRIMLVLVDSHARIQLAHINTGPNNLIKAPAERGTGCSAGGGEWTINANVTNTVMYKEPKGNHSSSQPTANDQ